MEVLYVVVGVAGLGLPAIFRILRQAFGRVLAQQLMNLIATIDVDPRQ